VKSVLRILTFLLVALLGSPLSPAAAAELAAGAKLAAQRCAKCHGKTGAGDGPGLKKINADVVPVDWRNRALMAKWSDEAMGRIIREGGKAVGKSDVMPRYRGKLTDAQIEDLIIYIRSLAR